MSVTAAHRKTQGAWDSSNHAQPQAIFHPWYTWSGTGYSHPVAVPENSSDPLIVIGDRNLACIFGIMQGCDLGAPANDLPSAGYESAYMTAQRYGGHTNYLFTDGHVQGLTLKQAMNQALWEWRAAGVIPP